MPNIGNSLIVDVADVNFQFQAEANLQNHGVPELTEEQPLTNSDVIKNNKDESANLVRVLYFFSIVAIMALLGLLLFYDSRIRKMKLELKNKDDEIKEQRSLFDETVHKLRDKDSKLKIIFDNSKLGVAILSKDGDFEFVNHTFARMVKYDIDEIYSLNNADLTHPDDKELTNEHINRLRKGEIDNFTIEKKLISKDGSPFWVQFSVGAVRNSDGSIKNMIGIVSDVSGSKKIERQSKDYMALLESIIQTIPSPVFYKDLDGKYIGCNDEFLQVIGYKREEVIGKSMYEFVPKKFVDLYHEKDLAVIQSGENQIYDAEVPDSEGKIRDMIFHKSALRSSNGEITGVVGIMIDITNYKSLEKKLRAAKVKAEQATYMKSMYLANMSHEIRTPMNGIIGMIEILKESGVRDEQAEYLEIINISSQNLLQIIDSILDYSKIESGEVILEEIDFSPREEVAEVLKMMHYKALEKNIILKTDIDLNVPEQLKGDPYRLKQILINLVNNAIKFSRKGDITIRIKQKERRKDQTLLYFEVEDQGIGISTEDQKVLFNPYKQATKSTSRKFGGTGLGLMISKNLAELMQGEIGVKSTLNEGSVFWFTTLFQNELTLNENEDKVSEIKKEEVIVPSDKELNILVAEDDFMNQRFLTILLGKLGHKFDVAEDGLITVEKFKEGNFDCILMDIDMPELDGLGATREIREIERKNGITDGVKIIAVTAKVIQGDRERCIEAGMNSYISKPFKSNDLNNVLVEVGLL